MSVCCFVILSLVKFENFEASRIMIFFCLALECDGQSLVLIDSSEISG